MTLDDDQTTIAVSDERKIPLQLPVSNTSFIQYVPSPAGAVGGRASKEVSPRPLQEISPLDDGTTDTSHVSSRVTSAGPFDNELPCATIDHNTQRLDSNPLLDIAAQNMGTALDDDYAYIGDQLAVDALYDQELSPRPYRLALIDVGRLSSHSPASNAVAEVLDSENSTTPDDSVTGIEEIPRSLEPLPDLLLNVPAYRDLFNHFVFHTADALIPMPEVYPQNPFKVLLPSMAMATPHLMSLVLAYGAAHRAMVMRMPEPEILIRLLLNRTFAGLSQSLQDPVEAKSDSTLAVAVLLSCFAVMSSTGDKDSWRVHLQGAREIIAARGVATLLESAISADADVYGPRPIVARKLGGSRDDMALSKELWFLVRFFAYMEIFVALSLTTATSSLAEDAAYSPTDQLLTLQAWHHAQTLLGPEHVDSAGQVDYVLGLDLQMIPMFATVIGLIRRRMAAERVRECCGNPDSSPADLDNECAEIVREGLEMSQMIGQYCVNEEVWCRELRGDGTLESLGTKSVHNVQLSTMSLLFSYATLIHLYRRVLMFDAASEQVKGAVQAMKRLLEENIPEGSQIHEYLTFPIFTAGCEAADDETREFYRSRLESLDHFDYMRRAKAIMEDSWRRNLPWTEVISDHGHSLPII